ncbi:ribosome biogenesis GTPase Der [bacterium]|nr:ribosome biogenesis GTPase Der [bacterium]
MKEIVAIIGRPNVGKSSLFNLLAQKQLAIVHDMPGVTRDRNYTTSEWYGVEYLLIDTGGIDYTEEKEIFKEMMMQATLAIEEATRIIFILDGKTGPTASDQELITYFRKTVPDKPVFYAVNKIDSSQKEDIILSDFYSIGLETIYPISVQQRRGIDDLMDDLFKGVETKNYEEDEKQSDIYEAKVAVIGRPNVGKSSFINKLLGTDRLIVHDESGTTRDSIDTEVTYFGQKYLFIDTAGIRRKAKIKYSLERYMVVKAFISVDRADVVIFVTDASEMLTDQDKKLLSLVTEKGKPVLIVVNKWDLIEKDSKTHKKYLEDLNYELREIKDPQVLFTSAKTGQRVFKVFEEIQKLREQMGFRVTTSELNRFMLEVINGHPHPSAGGRMVKFKYISQVATNPPTFMITVNHPDLVQTSYTRFLINHLRKRYPFGSVPIKVFFRGTHKDIDYN